MGASAPAATTTTTDVSATTTTSSSVVPDSVPALGHDLGPGSSDTKVGDLQQRLKDLAFDPGPIDGFFGDRTVSAVWAFERLVMGVSQANSTGLVTPSMWERMHQQVEITARRRPGGTHVEVYLPEQVAVVFTDAVPRLITHVSTGSGEQWCQEVTIDNDDGTQSVKGRCGISITPGGVFRFDRKIDGWRNAALGRLYKPIYFNYGIAIHGATSVPNRPASRGCVRIPMHIAEYFPDLVSIGDTVLVFDGVKDPEDYGAQLPVFDWPDPNWVDPTTTTTTTATTTSTTPDTTVPPSTTVPAPSSTSSLTSTSAPPDTTER